MSTNFQGINFLFYFVGNLSDSNAEEPDLSGHIGGLYASQPDGKDKRLIHSFEAVESALHAYKHDSVGEIILSSDGTRVAVVLALRHKVISGLDGVPVEAVFDAESIPTALFLLNLSDLKGGKAYLSEASGCTR